MYDPYKPQHWKPSARLPKLNKPTDAELRKAMDAIVMYEWADEQRDFDENPSEGHIYHALRVMHAHLYGKG